jgi:hypothetical protein
MLLLLRRNLSAKFAAEFIYLQDLLELEFRRNFVVKSKVLMGLICAAFENAVLGKPRNMT